MRDYCVDAQLFINSMQITAGILHGWANEKILGGLASGVTTTLATDVNNTNRRRGNASHAQMYQYVYTLRLIGPISYLGACYIHTKVTKCIRQKMTMYFRGLTIKSHSPGYEIGPINRSV